MWQAAGLASAMLFMAACDRDKGTANEEGNPSDTRSDVLLDFPAPVDVAETVPVDASENIVAHVPDLDDMADVATDLADDDGAPSDLPDIVADVADLGDVAEIVTDLADDNDTPGDLSDVVADVADLGDVADVATDLAGDVADVPDLTDVGDAPTDLVDVATDLAGLGDAQDTAEDVLGDSDFSDVDSGVDEANYVFVTSETVVPGQLNLVDGASDGLEGADITCNRLAAASGLPGTYLAWLSTSSVDAIARLEGARGWMRTDGVPFTDEPWQLIGGAHWYPIDRDEYGQHVVSALVVTGTSVSGTVVTQTCSDWTSSEGSSGGGAAGNMGRQWTTGNVPPCDGMLPSRLYCFGVDRDVAVSPPRSTGRLAFVSAGRFTPGGGFAEADSLCADEALAAGLPGSYLALLAGSWQSAASRFDLDGPMWIRVDGIPVGDLVAFLSGRLETSINTRASGAYTSDGLAFTGALTPSTSGTVETTCEGWTATLGDAPGGAVLTPHSFFWGFRPSCGGAGAVVYCLQE